ncbi:hypothetical protein KBY93_08415 [Synechococcus sp. J7-Johnson]|uniref:hypothetical protein n=1 Tax=Synechococcus sp. J7-Johnson TaxID=2823737 RepID=UPI0020CE2648|nr:hypothetical protein [Synechococcus sp. J7-Johnson]MCP9840659.1 hypothetical protein [Synechococcus sp. J7-Johnson]
MTLLLDTSGSLPAGDSPGPDLQKERSHCFEPGSARGSGDVWCIHNEVDVTTHADLPVGPEAQRLDAFAVSTAVATLVTLNRRHSPMLANLLVPYAKGG